MRSFPGLGAANAALVSLYFAPVWGADAIRALTSRFSGFEDRVHATAAGYFRAMLDLGVDGLMRTANVLAAIKLVAAMAFVAYLIDFARALVVGREPDRETLDAVLVLAGAAIMLWAWPALRSGDGEPDPPARHPVPAAHGRHDRDRGRAGARGKRAGFDQARRAWQHHQRARGSGADVDWAVNS